jgi:large subunit ribosomal protein L18e
MLANSANTDTIWTLRAAFKKTKAPIWKEMEHRLLKTKISKREVNVDKLSNYTKEGDIVIVPGKVLGGGNLGHSVVIYSYSISKLAAEKITTAGGKILELQDFIQKYPHGSGVKIIG